MTNREEGLEKALRDLLEHCHNHNCYVGRTLRLDASMERAEQVLAQPAAPTEKPQALTVYHHCKAHEHIPWRTTVTAYAGMVATVCPICEQRKEKK